MIFKNLSMYIPSMMKAKFTSRKNLFKYLPVLLLLSFNSWANNSDSIASPLASTIIENKAPQVDSLNTLSNNTLPSAKISLLPEVMGPGERLLWGKNGWMRSIGFPLTEESRLKEINLRRTMLTLHEVGGFLTLGAMITTAVYGQLTINGNTSLGDTHKAWASATIASYFTTAALSLLCPPPLIRRQEWNTVSIHKGLAIIHFTGMILTPLLADGIAMQERSNGTAQVKINHDKAQIHQISGYITTVAFASALMVITF